MKNHGKAAFYQPQIHFRQLKILVLKDEKAVWNFFLRDNGEGKAVMRFRN